MQEHWDSDLFRFGDGRICGIFLPFLRFEYMWMDLPLFLLHLRTAFFKAHLLSPYKKWQVCSLKSYKVLMETPYTRSKPLTWNKISEIFQWQKCFSELKISNPRISHKLNGVRRSSWKVVKVAKWSYASETSVRWQIFCSCSWQTIDTLTRKMKYQLHVLIDLNKNNQYWILLVKKTQISTSCLDRFYLLANFSGFVFWYFNTLSCILL